ncbi:MAG: anion transporter [Gammaproteobacteria bacterium]|nr:anion transporter [Gammaproteobacteria bacterium]
MAGWLGAAFAAAAVVGLASHLLGTHDLPLAHALTEVLGHNVTQIAAIMVFAMTYVAIALGRFPGLRLDRTGAALAGAACMVVTGVLTLNEAYEALDFNTITLLLGMMIVVANLRLSGLFRLASGWVATHARHPVILLSAVTLVSGVFSAFFVNDTICLALTPPVIEIAILLKRNPVPYLLAVAMACNVGSTATITGNPQNIIIGSFSHIPYVTFASALAPVAAVGLLLTIALIALIFRTEFWTTAALQAQPLRTRADLPLVLKSVLVALGMIVAFFLGLPPAGVAIVAGVLMLFTRRVKPEKVYAEVDWPLLVMFAGLFIVVAGLEKSVFSPHVIAAVGALHLEHLPILGGLTALLSNIVSNVPAVLVIKPFLGQLPDPQRSWLVVAMASTLAGNFTLVGSVANLIVVQRARGQGVEIGFWTYFKVGAPLTALTLVIGVLWL